MLGLAPYEVVDRIVRKLARTVLLAETESDPECVQIGSALTFRSGTGSVVSTKLVISVRQGPGQVVVTTPLGLALLGMPSGATLTVCAQGPAFRIDEVVPPMPPSPGMATSVSDFYAFNIEID